MMSRLDKQYRQDFARTGFEKLDNLSIDRL